MRHERDSENSRMGVLWEFAKSRSLNIMVVNKK